MLGQALGGLSARHVRRVPARWRYVLDALVGLATGFMFYGKQTAFETRGLEGGLAMVGFIALLLVGLNGYLGRRWQLAEGEPRQG